MQSGKICDNSSVKKVLIVEDEAKLARTVRLYLEQAGFEVVMATDGRQGLVAFRHERPSLVILDLNLPGELDGLDVCRELYRESKVPVIMLTARSEEADKLIGLEMGADDYITKPFSPREVVARVRAVLRRVDQSDAQPEIFQVASVQVNLSSRTVTISGVLVDLTRTEFDLLTILARYPGRVYTRAQILEQLLGLSYYEGDERTVDQHIKNLRHKIEHDPRQPRYILTARGVGYKLTEV